MDECIYSLKLSAAEIAFLEQVRQQAGFSNLNDFIKFCIRSTIDNLSREVNKNNKKNSDEEKKDDNK